MARAIPANDEAEFASIAETEGDYIGKYRLLELIGEGGMGRVYMAEQTEGVRRRVALKIIKLGMDTRQVIARFEAERQALALFDHPNITRVLDAGATESGRPYFVMELVRGTSISDYVAANRLSLRERLELFVDICRAVQHAHLKGIIHRDLKPSNILVTQFDGVPVPKVIDFGIAKAIGHQRLTDKTLFTRYAAMVGTPQYMSPEQAEMTGLDIDTRADIFSLGVVLYELITGTTPLPPNELSQLNPLALFETLRDANIETPSIRMSRIQKATRDSQSPRETKFNSSSSSFLPEPIKGDLDWVVMKAISRDRSQRYESASDLAVDVENVINGDPVNAAPPSRFYLLKTLYRKYRTATVSVLFFGSLLLVSSIACGILAVNNYRNSKLLAKSNQQLQTSVAQLQTLKVEKQYYSAVSLALVRYEVDLMVDSTREFQEQFLNKMPVDENGDIIEMSGEALLQLQEEIPEPTFFSTACQCRETLLELSLSALLESAMTPVRNAIKEQEDFNRKIGARFSEQFPDKPTLAPNQPAEAYAEIDSQDTPQDRAISVIENRSSVEEQTTVTVNGFPLAVGATGDIMIHKTKLKFYRHLVKEYRREFGDKDQRVSQALNLLAGCLVDQKKFHEAESNLRESLLLGDAIDKEVASKMLAIVRDRQRQ